MSFIHSKEFQVKVVSTKYINPCAPLLGAIYLTPLDKAMEALPVQYIRFMDDWVIFVPNSLAFEEGH